MARVLVVDDHEIIRRGVALILETEGFEVRTVASGAEALACLEEGGIDLVTLDLGMPGMDGFEVLRRIRSTPATAELPVIVLTMHSDTAFRQGAEAAGASAYMVKDRAFDDLGLSIRALLDGAAEGSG